MNYTREQLLEDALDVAMRSLATYGEHPIIQQQARKAKSYQNDSDKNSVIDGIIESPDWLPLTAITEAKKQLKEIGKLSAIKVIFPYTEGKVEKRLSWCKDWVDSL